MADNGYTQPSGSTSGTYLSGYGPVDQGLPNPYKSIAPIPTSGTLTRGLDDPMALLAQSQQAVAANTPPIPDWKSVYNEAVQMRQERLTQELAAMQADAGRVSGIVHGLVGQPLPAGDGPLGRDFQSIWAQTGKFAEAQVPVMEMAAERGARSKASDTLDAIMSQLSGNYYQGRVSQAVNQPGNVMSAMGHFTALANDRAAAARAELDAFVKQRIEENQAQHVADNTQFTGGVDLLKAGLTSDTSRYTAGLQAQTQFTTNQNTVQGQLAANQNTVQGAAANTAANIAAQAPSRAALTDKYTAEAARQASLAKDGAPLTAFDKARAAKLGQTQADYTGWYPSPGFDPTKPPTPEHLANIDEVLRNLGYLNYTGGLKTEGARAYLQNLGKVWAAQKGNIDKKATPQQKDIQTNRQVNAWYDTYGRLAGVDLTPSERQRVIQGFVDTQNRLNAPRSARAAGVG